MYMYGLGQLLMYSTRKMGTDIAVSAGELLYVIHKRCLTALLTSVMYMSVQAATQQFLYM